ncbi:hypothetical protein COB28_02730 [Candidatus Dependentiae bacterium]|nr:MAG: hypothetical protein COB28_02730 [Candidatus Dependentiae bacterium]
MNFILKNKNYVILTLVLVLSNIQLNGATKKKNLFETMYSSFFQQKEEKKTASKKKKTVASKYHKSIKNEGVEIKPIKDKKKICSQSNSYKQWHELHDSIQETGYYSVTGNEKIKTIKDDLWYAQSPWPFAAQNYLKRDHLEIEVAASFADRAFFNHESTNMSPLIFGKKCVQLQDFLLISRLLKDEKITGVVANNITSVYKHYAEQEIEFKTSFNSQTININYARHWLDGLLSVGIQLPIVRKSHRFKLSVPRNDKLETDFFINKQGAALNTPANLLDPNNPTFEARKGFLQDHPTGIESFINTVLEQKNINVSGRNHNDTVGSGDITFFLNGHYDFAYCKESTLGIKITLPISKTRKLNTIWAPDLGNGGFVTFTGHAGFQWHSDNNLLNPHIYSQLTISMISSVDRRVPLVRKYDGTNPGSLLTPRYGSVSKATDGFFLYGHATEFLTNKTFAEPDSTVKELSDHITRVHIRPGVLWQTRIGNLFQNLIVKNLSCNIYYDVMIKGLDSVGFYDQINDGFDRDFLKENTNQDAHRVGGTIHYQFDDTFRISAEFKHLFAGKNVIQTSDFSIGFNADF